MASKWQGQLSCTHTTGASSLLYPRHQHLHAVASWEGASSARPLDINMASVSSPDYRHPHGLWWSQRPQTSTPPLTVSRPQINSWPSAAAQTSGLIMGSGGCTCHSHQHGPPRQQSPRDITKSSVGSADRLHPHGAQASSQLPVAARTTDTNVASGGITDFSWWEGLFNETS